MYLTTTILVWSIVAHTLADWLLQNDWMANNKTNLLHPAAYVHGLIHLVCLLIVFPIWAALIVALIHILLDTRKPLLWWRRFYKRTTDGDVPNPVAIWEDQALHLMILAVMSIIVANFSTPSIILAFLAK